MSDVRNGHLYRPAPGSQLVDQGHPFDFREQRVGPPLDVENGHQVTASIDQCVLVVGRLPIFQLVERLGQHRVLRGRVRLPHIDPGKPAGQVRRRIGARLWAVIAVRHVATEKEVRNVACLLDPDRAQSIAVRQDDAIRCAAVGNQGVDEVAPGILWHGGGQVHRHMVEWRGPAGQRCLVVGRGIRRFRDRGNLVALHGEQQRLPAAVRTPGDGDLLWVNHTRIGEQACQILRVTDLKTPVRQMGPAGRALRAGPGGERALPAGAVKAAGRVSQHGVATRGERHVVVVVLVRVAVARARRLPLGLLIGVAVQHDDQRPRRHRSWWKRQVGVQRHPVPRWHLAGAEDRRARRRLTAAHAVGQ